MTTLYASPDGIKAEKLIIYCVEIGLGVNAFEALSALHVSHTLRLWSAIFVSCSIAKPLATRHHEAVAAKETIAAAAGRVATRDALASYQP